MQNKRCFQFFSTILFNLSLLIIKYLLQPLHLKTKLIKLKFFCKILVKFFYKNHIKNFFEKRNKKMIF